MCARSSRTGTDVVTGARLDIHTWLPVAVHESIGKWADVPDWMTGCHVWIDSAARPATMRDLPRSIRDCAGMVLDADWLGQDLLTVAVKWTPAGRWVLGLITQGLAHLTLVVSPSKRHVMVEVMPFGSRDRWEAILPNTKPLAHVMPHMAEWTT